MGDFCSPFFAFVATSKKIWFIFNSEEKILLTWTILTASSTQSTEPVEYPIITRPVSVSLDLQFAWVHHFCLLLPRHICLCYTEQYTEEQDTIKIYQQSLIKSCITFFTQNTASQVENLSSGLFLHQISTIQNGKEKLMVKDIISDLFMLLYIIGHQERKKRKAVFQVQVCYTDRILALVKTQVSIYTDMKMQSYNPRHLDKFWV